MASTTLTAVAAVFVGRDHAGRHRVGLRTGAVLMLALAPPVHLEMSLRTEVRNEAASLSRL